MDYGVRFPRSDFHRVRPIHVATFESESDSDIPAFCLGWHGNRTQCHRTRTADSLPVWSFSRAPIWPPLRKRAGSLPRVTTSIGAANTQADRSLTSASTDARKLLRFGSRPSSSKPTWFGFSASASSNFSSKTCLLGPFSVELAAANAWVVGSAAVARETPGQFLSGAVGEGSGRSSAKSWQVARARSNEATNSVRMSQHSISSTGSQGNRTAL